MKYIKNGKFILPDGILEKVVLAYDNKICGFTTVEEIPAEVEAEIVDLLIRWHYETVVLPSITEPEVEFDPYDESQVDLTGLPHVTTEAAE